MACRRKVQKFDSLIVRTLTRILDDMTKLVGKDASSISQKQFDPQGRYKKVVDAVRKVGSGELGFFRIDLDNTRVEYFIVSVDKKDKRLVGMKAVAIES